MGNELGNKELMAANIKRYMGLKNITRNELCKALGFNYSTLSDWLHARKYPRIDKIEKMANYFGINKADLVEAPLSDTEKEDFCQSAILARAQQKLSPEQLKILEDMAKALLDSHEEA